MENFVAVAIGACIGVVAGSVVQFGANILMLKFFKKNQKQNLKKELQYNLSLVGDLSNEVVKLRNAVNGGVLGNYYGYYKCSDGLFLQVTALAQNAVLYEIFSEENIRKLQKIVSILSIHHEGWLNESITKYRDQFVSQVGYVQADCVNFVDLIDNQFTELEGFIGDLSEAL